VAVEEAELIREGILQVARLMAVAAKTAPKARGVDNIIVKVIHGREELERLASKMDELASEFGSFFSRDAGNVRNSDAIVLIGAKVVDLGLKSPPEYKLDVNVAMSLINLGIALGSAVKTASLMNVDNRVMYTIGLAAQRLNLIEADYVLGVPLSAKAKNIYFDRRA